ncbi:hypothetical protein OIO11_13315 [Clostridium sp. ZS2-4]|nr:hypothetical protein [Clostridium sp. ZS2-4]
MLKRLAQIFIDACRTYDVVLDLCQ